MNKPLVSAIAGVAFGITLCASVYHLRQSTRRPVCCAHSTQIVVTLRPAVLLPPLRHATEVAQPEGVRSACEPGAPAPLPRNSDQRLSIAQTEYVNGNYDCAMKLARSEIRHSPARSYRILGAAACAAGDPRLANEAFRHLDSAARQYLIYACHRQGLLRTDQQFTRNP